MKKILAGTFFCLAHILAFAQQPDLKGFKKLDDSLYLKRAEKGKGRHIRPGDYVYLRTQLYSGKDSLVFDTRQFHDQPVELRLLQKEGGPLEEGLHHLRAGDSAILAFPASRMYDSIRPDFVRPGLWMQYRIRVYRSLDSLSRQKEKALRARKMLNLQDSIIAAEMMQKGMTVPFRTPSGVIIYWHRHGDGTVAERGDYLSLHYRGRLLDGTIFDDSYQRNEPLNYIVGEQRLIPGWEEAVSFLAEGDSVTFYIPSPLAYGESGSGWTIPPDAVLIFDMKVLETSNAAHQLGRDTLAIRQYLRQHGKEAIVYPNGVALVVKKEGQGALPQAGQLLSMAYRMRLMSGQVIEDHWNTAFKYRLNTGQLPKGLEYALLRLPVGSEAEILIPSGLGYGPRGTDRIPSDAVLIYEVRMEGVE